ncbi:MAG: cupin domain-containing protein [SAR324 cluster bacterium]|nr:cupin domain-containing protein [SAR324 cluster bacterium]
MKVIKISDVPEQVVESDNFIGGAVTRQPLVTEDMGQSFNMSIVNFSPGARNKFHTHSSDLILLVTAGKGIVASETEEHVVGMGEIIHIKAGENHWHGATKDSAFSHITLTAR